MDQLTIAELQQSLTDSTLLDYHPDYHPELWKDGTQAPFILTKITANPAGKGQQTYFVKYKCSNPDCKRCNSTGYYGAYGGHFLDLTEKGYDEFDRVEFIEMKKKTEIKYHKHPVFVKYQEKKNE